MNTDALLEFSAPLIVALGITVALLSAALGRSRAVAAAAVLSLAAAFAAVWLLWGAGYAPAAGLLRMDRLALFFSGVLLASGLGVAGLAAGLTVVSARTGIFHLLLLTAVLGALVLASADHFAAVFLGLELLSLAIVGLTAAPGDGRSLEAGAKYLILGAVASGLFLFGAALVLAGTGSLRLDAVGTGRDPVVVLGALLIATGLAFKLSLVPLHMWAADVFDGASPPVAALIATVSKGAVAAVLVRMVLAGSPGVATVLAWAAAASMLAGNLLALRQENLKRLLGYSSIAHMGYLVVAVAAAGPLGAEAAGYYVAAYSAAMLTAFGVLAASGARADLEGVRGMAWSRPVLASALVMALLSLAGIPVTMGFVGKFYLFAAGIDAGLGWLIAAMIAGSVIGLFYYLRVAAALFRETTETAPFRVVPPAAGIVLAIAAILLILLGLYPTPVVDIARAAAESGIR